MTQWKATSYSVGEITRMRQEAMERVRQMQNRSREALQSTADTAHTTTEVEKSNSTAELFGLSPDTQKIIDEITGAFGSKTQAAQPPTHEADRIEHAVDSVSHSEGEVHTGDNMWQSYNSQNRRTGRNTRRPSPPPLYSAPEVSAEEMSDSTDEASKGLSGLGETLKTTIANISEPVSKILDALNIDGERLIILIVMLIILNERGDKTLLLALGYLLL